eukprot:6103374-Pleurochrysis_carterae.AAC.1
MAQMACINRQRQLCFCSTKSLRSRACLVVFVCDPSIGIAVGQPTAALTAIAVPAFAAALRRLRIGADALGVLGCAASGLEPLGLPRGLVRDALALDAEVDDVCVADLRRVQSRRIQFDERGKGAAMVEA